MPSAPEYLKDKFPGGDQEAMAELYFAGYQLSDKYGRTECTAREADAIDYLCWEWDFYGIDLYGNPLTSKKGTQTECLTGRQC